MNKAGDQEIRKSVGRESEEQGIRRRRSCPVWHLPPPTAHCPKEDQLSSVYRQGFTLIELTVVVILIGVIFVVVFPHLTGLFSGRKLLGFCREMAGTLDYARSRAVIDGRIYTAHISRDRREYWITSEDETGDYYGRAEERPEPKKRKIPDEISVKQLKLGKRIVERFEPVIRFYPRGNSNGAEIILETDRGDKATIKVKPYTGRSEVKVVE